LPNVLYVSVLKALLWYKDWKYMPFGVLDRTHLRFFTKKSIRRMFDETDYDLLVIRGINASCRVPTKILAILSLGYFAESRFQQYACVARPRNSKETQGG
jgi:hypothetical protein